MDEVTLPPGSPGPPHPFDVPEGYRILTELSRTRMSVLYKAEEVSTGREVALHRAVALKVLSPVLTEDEGFRTRFEREALLVANLDHPNIIPVYRAKISKLCYIAMRFVDGPDLGAYLEDKGTLTLPETVRIVDQAAAALDAAHAEGLVHRDIKPSNLLLDRKTGHLYVVDFGIVKHVSAPRLTEAGRFLGTPEYAPPEQLRGVDVDGRADVYALGAVLFQCLTGQVPFPRQDLSALMYAHINDPPPKVSDHRPDLPADLDAVVARAMAKAPENRYPTCSELAAELAGISRRMETDGRSAELEPRREGTEPESSPPSGTSQRSWPGGLRRHPKRTLAVLGLLAGLMIAAGVIWAAVQADTPSSQALARIPEALRADCEESTPPNQPSGVTTTLSCSAAGSDQEVLFSLFETSSDLTSAYDEAVRDSGITRSTGDCASTTGGEHLYPAVGEQRGRVLCAARNGTTALIWTDDRTRTMASASVLSVDDAALIEAWSSWMGIPAFPAPAEEKLRDLVDLAGCRRAPAAGLDKFRDAIAAIECPSPEDGARTISYYEFASLEGLRRTYNSHVTEAGAPSDVYCGDGTKSAPGFLGNKRWDIRSVDLGGLLCYPAGDNEFVIEWAVEPLKVLGIAVGADANELAEWWSGYHGPPADAIVTELNRQADPPFPTLKEEALLEHIPSAAQVNCIRPSQEQIELNVPVETTVTGVVCGPTRGAPIVFYYQFPDTESMNANYAYIGGADGADCTTTPPGFVGSSSYPVDGVIVGKLACGTNEGGNHYISWTDERVNIQAFAFQATDTAVLLDWWRSSEESGPLP